MTQALAQAHGIDMCLRIRHVVAVTGLSRSTIYALISTDKFPKPIKLSTRAVAWRSSVVQEWIKQREQQS
jgi:prophage regulatory protein